MTSRYQLTQFRHHCGVLGTGRPMRWIPHWSFSVQYPVLRSPHSKSVFPVLCAKANVVPCPLLSSPKPRSWLLSASPSSSLPSPAHFFHHQNEVTNPFTAFHSHCPPSRAATSIAHADPTPQSQASTLAPVIQAPQRSQAVFVSVS